MDIHRPKSLENWRDLAKEVGVIVIGVCIALLGEQAVEWLHWRNEVADTRDALNVEISHDIGTLDARASQAACIQGRLADVRTVLAMRATGRPAALKAPLGQPLFWRPNTSVWQTALSGQVAAHMPLEMRLRHAGFYDYLNWFAARETEEADAWTVLGSLNDLPGSDSQGAWDSARLAGAPRPWRTRSTSTRPSCGRRRWRSPARPLRCRPSRACSAACRNSVVRWFELGRSAADRSNRTRRRYTRRHDRLVRPALRRIIDGKAFAQHFARTCRPLGRSREGPPWAGPGLAVVIVGEDPASQIYVRNKGEQTQEAGMRSDTHALPDTTTQAELLALVEELNADPGIHGILVQMPLPAQIDSAACWPPSIRTRTWTDFT